MSASTADRGAGAAGPGAAATRSGAGGGADAQATTNRKGMSGAAFMGASLAAP